MEYTLYVAVQTEQSVVRYKCRADCSSRITDHLLLRMYYEPFQKSRNTRYGVHIIWYLSNCTCNVELRVPVLTQTAIVVALLSWSTTCRWLKKKSKIVQTVPPLDFDVLSSAIVKGVPSSPTTPPPIAWTLLLSVVMFV